MAKRPPIIAVLGSVDHGKTTLLDYIRKTNIAAKEAGGITQSIGAYEILHNGQKITFIDTPGHEAFTTLRARGAQAADIAILVVAADDGVQPQTKEAIDHLRKSGTPFVVAINKIDKSGADVNRVKRELAKENVLLEGYGGDVSFQEISAKTGQGVSELLDLLLLAADMKNLQYNPKGRGEGFILEAKMDAKRGIVASAIVKNGELKIGDEIVAGSAEGRVKALENFKGEMIKKAEPSTPVTILGFKTLPKVGDVFVVGGKTVESERKNKTALPKEGALNIILRADVFGSLEALSQIVKNLPTKEGQEINVIDENVGNISDGDVKLAASTKSIIVGFNVKTDKAASNLARAKGVSIITSNIIYDLTKALEEHLKSLELISGKVEILAVFSKKGNKQIIGGKVIEGEIKNHSRLGIERGGEIIGTGRVINLQQNKEDVQKVEAGNECGILFDSDIEIKKGDILLAK